MTAAKPADSDATTTTAAMTTTVAAVTSAAAVTVAALANGGCGVVDGEGAQAMTLVAAAALVKQEDRGHPERKRRASDESLDSSTRTSELGAEDTVKEEEDDDDVDDDDKILPGHNHDPERLKAFNMFVRLFVDENLDRIVPISKQPKDKIQAILDACDRQFPEFHERSRKRIRTYLKSCRRMRRSKENGWEALRPTPPHLTSAAAEGILAQACENESNNAKRMRMGLDPLPANVVCGSTLLPASASHSQHGSPQSQPSPQPVGVREQQTPPQITTTTPAILPQTTPIIVTTAASVAVQPLVGVTVSTAPPTVTVTSVGSAPSGSTFIQQGAHAFRPPHELPSPFFTNSNGIFRPAFPAYQPPAHSHPAVPIQHSTLLTPTHIQNGPTDLSMKKTPSSGSTTSKNQLNPTEVATIKQLIAGYRESAAFLYRSADELEQLLHQQN